MDLYPMLIDGEWVDSTGGKYIEVENPAIQTIFAKVPKATTREVDIALEAAHRSFSEWSKLSPFKRGEYLIKSAEILEKRAEKIARLMTQEQGKPLLEAWPPK